MGKARYHGFYCLTRLWPLSALVVWTASWAIFGAAQVLGAPLWLAFALAFALGLVLARLELSFWRQCCIVLGFPLSLAVSGQGAGLPAWAWLLLGGILLALYPWRVWQDAPFFPTRPGQLEDLDKIVPLPKQARILDAGCGLGHGLMELRRVYPQAWFIGVEWSWLLRLGCAWRCPWAEVRQGDIWGQDWSGYDLVYMFQRPENMGRAARKALAELRSGAYFISLEFKAPGLAPLAVVENRMDKPVWVYQIHRCEVV